MNLQFWSFTSFPRRTDQNYVDDYSLLYDIIDKNYVDDYIKALNDENQESSNPEPKFDKKHEENEDEYEKKKF